MLKRLIYAFFVALVFLLVFLCFSCNPEKTLQRKEDKAFGVVVGSDRVFPKVAERWLRIHPCVITTPKPDVIITKTDTILQEKKIFIPVKVTQYKNRVLDTIIDGISVYADSNGLVVKNLNGVITRTNTVTKTIVDQTLADNQRDTINSLRQQLASLNGQIYASEKANKERHDSDSKEKRTWILLFIGLAVVSVASHILRSYLFK